jgi:autotransporter passenger strand-loop-strand repeat protein
MSGSTTVPTLTAFTSGDLVISVYGDGDGSGTYTDNQAAPITLEELNTNGTIVGQLVLPETTTVRNGVTEYAISGEYGSSSEGTLELSADGQSLVIAGYGVNDVTYNTGGAAVYGDARLAQSTSVKGGTYTAVARVIADISYNGTVDTSTALYNIANTNNPRSVSTVNGTSFYVTAQGVKGDTTQGVFYAQDGASSATAIDTSTDTRTAEIYNGELYVSRDSTQGTSGTSNISDYGTTLPKTATTPTTLVGIGGTVTLTAAQENTVNSSAVGTTVHLSPENFFFANATTLYVADSGNPKEGGLGDGGLQKWTLANGTWTLDYTLSAGLNLVADTATSGTTGLIGLTGVVVGNTVELYTTNSTLGDLDQTYLFGIDDTLTATTETGETFTTLVTAAADTNIRGIAFAPTAAAVTPTTTTVSSGVTSTGLTVTSGSTLTVLNGGAIVSATILSGGIATISSGGTDTGTTIAQGATETVLGSATGDQVEGTQIVSAATAVVSNETVFNGGAVDLFLKGATASGITVNSGGALNISGAATASNTILSGGVLDIESAKAVLAGSLVFAGGGTLKIDAVLSAGSPGAVVISGFVAGDIINDTAIAVGATLTTATVSGNTVATISGGGTTQAFTFAGAVANLTLTSNGTGGEEIVIGVAAPTTTTVSSGSTQSNLIVTSGNTLNVLSGGTVINTMILSGGTATVSGAASGTTISAGGTAIITGTDTASTVAAGGTETVLGTATGDQIYGTQLVSATGAAANGETVHSGGTVNLFLKGETASALVVQSGGTVNISGNATASDTVMSGGIFNLESGKSVLSGGFTFAGPATLEATAVISAGYGALGVISGFTTGDVIDETVIGTGATLTSAVVSGNTVETITSGAITEAFTFAGTYAAGHFVLTPDSGTGVELVTAACYCPGTLILTSRGEVPVEDLAIGDHVATLSSGLQAVRWIGRRSYAGAFVRGNHLMLPVTIKAGALEPGVPVRDLHVSPGHAIFLDGALVPAWRLVNGVTVTQAAAVEAVTYLHIDLAEHEVIFAEGCPAESFIDDNCRHQFHNAATFDLLYPDATDEMRTMCAPRIEDGWHLQAIQHRIAARAGIEAPVTIPGSLRGFVDEPGPVTVSGWAQDQANPEQPVCLDVFANGRRVARVLANRYRADLRDAGIGSGTHAFTVDLPLGCVGSIEIRRTVDAAPLALTEDAQARIAA